MSEQETSNHKIGDQILYSLDGTPQEAIITDTTRNCVRIISRSLAPHWILRELILDNLGPATEFKLRVNKLDHLIKDTAKATPCHHPAPQTPPPYRTGTYILESQEGPVLIDVDKIDNTYYFRLSGESKTTKMTNDIWQGSYEFSDPDKGNYYIEPGIYYCQGKATSLEIVPYNGISYYRVLDDPKIYRLHKNDVKLLKRFESDSLEINAIMIIDKTEIT